MGSEMCIRDSLIAEFRVFTDHTSCSSLNVLYLNHQGWRLRGLELRGIAQIRSHQRYIKQLQCIFGEVSSAVLFSDPSIRLAFATKAEM